MSFERQTGREEAEQGRLDDTNRNRQVPDTADTDGKAEEVKSNANATGTEQDRGIIDLKKQGSAVASDAPTEDKHHRGEGKARAKEETPQKTFDAPIEHP
ncbi:unnamed protein product [Diplocarpon coronariae]|uniref:Uncharacterized protein n=1 Tax=Diplocarpon coronariae TaxID=2795749 RepID=A0A218Z4W6_9HELO|nr:hypothetical protein JHW43_008786 [Diplocarpon mali]OWP02573.1 hypothetical protein B2J93_5204 [Marssonina coronariae]